VLAAALALSGAAIAGLPHTAPVPRPAAAAVVPVEHAQPQTAPRGPQPGHWVVKVDGWSIELDQVAARHIPVLDPEPVEAAIAVAVRWSDRALRGDRWDRLAPDRGSDLRGIALRAGRRQQRRRLRTHAGVRSGGAEMGEENFHEPEANIRTGIRYLQRLQREYAGARDFDRQALALAAYNMGLAHVQDAQALARRFGYDPLRWDGAMDVMVSLLEEPQVYDHLPSGFAQGRSVVDYVDRVLRRFAGYRRELPATPPGRVKNS
jgi:hypothetical protein